MVSSATTREAKKAKKAEDAAEQARIALEASKKGAQDPPLDVRMCNATTLVRDINMLCVRACDYVTCTAHTVYRVGCHGVYSQRNRRAPRRADV